MKNSLFKNFEMIHLELQVLLKRAKNWKLSDKEQRKIDDWISRIDEVYRKVKERCESEGSKRRLKIL